MPGSDERRGGGMAGGPPRSRRARVFGSMPALADTEKSKSVEDAAQKEGAGERGARAARHAGLRRSAELPGHGNPMLAEIDARIRSYARRFDRIARTVEKETRDGARMTGGRAIALRVALDAAKAGLVYAQQERAACIKGGGYTGTPVRLVWEDGTPFDDRVSPERVLESERKLFAELRRPMPSDANGAVETAPVDDNEPVPAALVMSLDGSAVTFPAALKSYPTIIPMGRWCGVGARGEALGAPWSRGDQVTMQATCLD